MPVVDTRWLRLLVELADRGTLRAAADASGYSTSAVSQQLAALQRELGASLVEPAGRRLRLTPAGQAFLPHARTVLRDLDAARGRLDPQAGPQGPVRLAGYATALLRRVVPAVRELRAAYPELRVAMEEREPDEVLALLGEDAVDVGLVYEYSLVPHARGGRRFGEEPMGLIVPVAENRSPTELLADPDTAWITNSRTADDDELVLRLGAADGVVPRIAHRIDSLELVGQLVAAGLGVALVAAVAPRVPGVRFVDLQGRAGHRAGYALTRPGRETWPAHAALIAAICG